MAHPLIVAHRGYSAKAPENTLAAVQMALDAGVDAIEIDVRMSADGVPVVIHDETVDRTTASTGRVADLTAAQLGALDAGSWMSEKFSDQMIPTLRQVLELTAGRVQLVVELKEEGSEVAVAELVREMNAGEWVTVISFHRSACEVVRDIMPEVGTLWLLAPGSVQHPELAANAAVVLGLQGLDVHHSMVDEHFATLVLRRGLSLWAWTVNDPARARDLAALGVAAITTDDPGAIRGGM